MTRGWRPHTPTERDRYISKRSPKLCHFRKYRVTAPSLLSSTSVPHHLRLAQPRCLPMVLVARSHLRGHVGPLVVLRFAPVTPWRYHVVSEHSPGRLPCGCVWVMCCGSRTSHCGDHIYRHTTDHIVCPCPHLRDNRARAGHFQYPLVAYDFRIVSSDRSQYGGEHL